MSTIGTEINLREEALKFAAHVRQTVSPDYFVPAAQNLAAPPPLREMNETFRKEFTDSMLEKFPPADDPEHKTVATVLGFIADVENGEMPKPVAYARASILLFAEPELLYSFERFVNHTEVGSWRGQVRQKFHNQLNELVARCNSTIQAVREILTADHQDFINRLCISEISDPRGRAEALADLRMSSGRYRFFVLPELGRKLLVLKQLISGVDAYFDKVTILTGDNYHLHQSTAAAKEPPAPAPQPLLPAMEDVNAWGPVSAARLRPRARGPPPKPAQVGAAEATQSASSEMAAASPHSSQQPPAEQGPRQVTASRYIISHQHRGVWYSQPVDALEEAPAMGSNWHMILFGSILCYWHEEAPATEQGQDNEAAAPVGAAQADQDSTPSASSEMASQPPPAEQGRRQDLQVGAQQGSAQSASGSPLLHNALAASPATYLDRKILVCLDDGRKFVGTLRSLDQDGNIVIEDAVERVIVGHLYSDIAQGRWIVLPGENVDFIGEMEEGLMELPGHMISVSTEEIRRVQQAERDSSYIKSTMSKRMDFLNKN